MQHSTDKCSLRRATLLAFLALVSLTGAAMAQTTSTDATAKSAAKSGEGGAQAQLIGGGGGGAAIMHNTPAEKFAVAPGGVDMRTMRYVYHETDLSIGGEGDDGLALTRSTPTSVPQQPVNPFGNFSFNWDISFDLFRVSIYDQQNTPGNPLPPGNDYQVYVNIGGRASTFQAYYGNGYSSLSKGIFERLTFTGTQGTLGVIYSYIDDQHDIITFAPLGTVDGIAVTGIYATALIKPDGTQLTFEYSAFAGPSGNLARVRSITSSRGYALLLESTGGLVTKACTLNLAQTLIPANHLCPTGASATATYGYSGNKLTSVTAPDGAVSSFVYGTSGGNQTIGFVRPGYTSPWLTNTLGTAYDELGYTYDIVAAQNFVDGQSYSYTPKYTPFVTDRPSSIAGGYYIDALGNRTTVSYYFPQMPGTGPNSQCTHPPCSPAQIGTLHYQQTAGPVTILDPLGRTTSSDYCDPYVLAHPPGGGGNCLVTLLQSFTDPEGIKTSVTYDNWRNVTQMVRSPKAGSGLADQTTLATFDCTQPVSCAKPISVTDPNGNVTSYTYDATHGGILSETGPADSHGVQRVKRYAYVQRYAWVSDGAGGYVHGAVPMWLLSTEKTCNTSATSGGACVAGTGDEVTTSYDYGPDAGPNNLWLRGKVVTAGGVSLRTCFGHDAAGNQISQTSPRANLTVCP